MAIRRIGSYYYIYYRESGRLITRALHTTDEAEARLRADRFDALRRADRHLRDLVALFGAPVVPTAAVLTSAPAADGKRLRLTAMLDVAEKTSRITREKRIYWPKFVAAIGVTYADQVTPRMAAAYLEAAYGGNSAKSYNNVRSALDGIFRHCLVAAGLTASPFAPIPPRARKTEPEHHRPLTVEEFRRIYVAAPEPWKTAALISWHTALRLETVFRLSWAAINEADRSLTIMPGKTARFGRAVYIPIHPELWAHLTALPRPADPATPILSQWSTNRQRFPGFPKLTYFCGLLRSLGINDTADGKASFHSLRVSFVTRCDAAGIRRTATRGIAGHTTDKMTDLYSHDTESAKAILNLPAAGI